MSTALWNQEQAQALIDAFIEAGAAHAVISPGSRNTPIVLAIAARPNELTAHVALDERSAGFLALGLARESGAPTLLTCTSGSALAHYLPAVIEASEAGIPLLVLSADRPPELQDCGAPQAIQQADVLSSHTRGYFPCAPPDGAHAADQAIKTAQDALVAALGQDPGPVHLNLAYREPLWDPKLPLAPAFTGSAQAPSPLESTLSSAEEEGLLELMIAAKRGLIVCGHYEGSNRAQFGASVRALGAALNWPVIAEPSSGARFGGSGPADTICHADSILRSHMADELRPDFVLRFGRNPTSKPVYQWLARQEQATQHLVDRRSKWNDPFKISTQLWSVDERTLCANLVSCLSGQASQCEPEWREQWINADRAARTIIEAHCAGALWEGSVAHHLSLRLPNSSLLHVASSMPIRDVDGLSIASSQKIDVFANRGANGIDGTIATFVGEMLARERGVGALLIGDLAFLHDANSLQMADSVQRPATIVVVDNGGGGIFQYLPISQNEGAFETYFVTPQNTKLQSLCEAYGVPYTWVDNQGAYEAALGLDLERPGLSVVHVTLDAEESYQRHLALWDSVGKALPGGRS